MKVLVVCSRRYNGQEFWGALGSLQQAGIEYEVISTGRIILDELTAKANSIERTINDVDLNELDLFDGLMVISGNMDDTQAYWKDKKVQAYVDRAQANDMPIAAICCAVPTVRNAANGKRVSFFPLIRCRDLLEQAGAILNPVALTVDGKLVTAEHAMATQMWAEAFVDVLNGRTPEISLQDSGFRPRGTERKPLPILERLKKGTR